MANVHIVRYEDGEPISAGVVLDWATYLAMAQGPERLLTWEQAALLANAPLADAADVAPDTACS